MVKKKLNILTYFLTFMSVAVAITVAIFAIMPTNANQASANETYGMSGITSLQVGLVWSDNVEPHTYDDALVILLENGQQAGSWVLNADHNNCWIHTFTGLNSSANYEVREVSTFTGYYTTYEQGVHESQPFVHIRNIKEGSPAPPWPTPEPQPGQWTDIIISPSNTPNANVTTDSPNQQIENSDNNQSTASGSLVAPGNNNDEVNEDMLFFKHFDKFTKIAIVAIPICFIFVLFGFEYLGARKKR